MLPFPAILVMLTLALLIASTLTYLLRVKPDKPVPSTTRKLFWRTYPTLSGGNWTEYWWEDVPNDYPGSSDHTCDNSD